MPDTESADKPTPVEAEEEQASEPEHSPREYGGPKGKEPTRYGDWVKNGRCIDF